jgi:hypothetical protein
LVISSSRAYGKLPSTKEKLSAMADEVYVKAMEAGQFSAAVATIREIGVLTGRRIERSERGQPGEFDNVSTEQRLAELHNLGYTVDAPPSQAVN